MQTFFLFIDHFYRSIFPSIFCESIPARGIFFLREFRVETDPIFPSILVKIVKSVAYVRWNFTAVRNFWPETPLEILETRRRRRGFLSYLTPDKILDTRGLWIIDIYRYRWFERVSRLEIPSRPRS